MSYNKSFKQVREDLLREVEYDKSREHPTPTQLFALEGIKELTPKQREIWEFIKFDKLTHQEIADKLHISRPVVSKHYKAAINRMAKWFKLHENVYDVLIKNYDKL